MCLVCPIYVLDQTFEDSVDLLLLINDDKWHYVHIKDFNRFMFHKIKDKSKIYFCKNCLQCFSSKNVLTKHKEDCKVVCIDDRFTKPIVVFRSENAAYEFVKAILKECAYCKKLIKKQLNKNLIMSDKEEHLFQQSNSCWICEKVIDNDEEKVRDHCHVTGKFRGAAHWSCNINLQLTKKVWVMFHNLRDYDSHLIFCELKNFDVKISVIPNGLEKYMVYFSNKNLVFIDSMQLMDFRLDKLVKNLSDEGFKYFVEEFCSTNLGPLKQNAFYSYDYMNSFERFNEKNLPARKYFYSSTKDGKIGNDGKNWDGHIGFKDYLTCEKIWDKFDIKDMGDYHDHYLKKDVLLLAYVFEKLIFQFSWIELACDVKNGALIHWKRIKRRNFLHC